MIILSVGQAVGETHMSTADGKSVYIPEGNLTPHIKSLKNNGLPVNDIQAEV